MSGDFIIGAGTQPIVAQVEGLLAWWTLAGVEHPVCEEPVDWVRPQAASRVGPNPPSSATAPGFPASLPAFHDYLAMSPDLPESAWPGPRVLPQGPQAAKLMIIIDAPDSAASQPDALFGPDATSLLTRMAGTIGLRMEDCYLAPLSLVAPPAGIVASPVLERLAERMRHHIDLVNPSALLLLGDQASRALISTEALEKDKNLPFVNHLGGNLRAASVAHPRVMLGQPSAKAEAWRMLQGLTRGWGQ